MNYLTRAASRASAAASSLDALSVLKFYNLFSFSHSFHYIEGSAVYQVSAGAWSFSFGLKIFYIMELIFIATLFVVTDRCMLLPFFFSTLRDVIYFFVGFFSLMRHSFSFLDFIILYIILNTTK